MKYKPLDKQFIREVLEYLPDTGELIWKETMSFRAKQGDIAGTLDKQGYRQVGIRGTTYKASRLVWFLVYGYDIDITKGECIYFKDRNLSNTRVENLELVSRKELADRRIYK